MSETLPLKELLQEEPTRDFPGDASQVAFPLGGIGTGNVSIGSRGQLKDWEIFNRPGKGTYLPYSFFAIWAQPEGRKAEARVLESRLNPPYSRATGFFPGEVAGLPRLHSSHLKGEYPFVWVQFEDNSLAVEVNLEAFTPLIPLNSEDSGIPGAVLRYRVVNPGPRPVQVTIVGSLSNAVGFDGYDHLGNLKLLKRGENRYREEDQLKGIYLSCPGLSSRHLKYGSMALLTVAPDITTKVSWLKGGWWDGIHDFWHDFSEDGRLEPASSFSAPQSNLHSANKMETGSLGICKKVEPGCEETFEFFLTWHFPNRINNWYDIKDLRFLFDREEVIRIVKSTSLKQKLRFAWHTFTGKVRKNYYSTLFNDAWEVGLYLYDKLEHLESKTRDFHRALFNSTLPSYVLEALASNISVLRSPTCFRLEDGIFLAFEGSLDNLGSCPGNCTHVWNYAQTAAFLFPDLERSMRRTEFALETDEDGKMNFRTMRVFDQNNSNVDGFPAVDGQLGSFVRLYRDWKISGDDNLVKELWPKASLALEYAFRQWDQDGDLVLEAKQHNTYDIDFYGPNSLSGSLFCAALKAASEMAAYLGYKEEARRYHQASKKSMERLDSLLWDGDYYVQKLDDIESYRYQYGKGCLSDQVFGQFLAHVAGLGYILPEQHVSKAVRSIFKHNFRYDFCKHENVQRTFTLNDEQGLLLCTWPKGGRPILPFVYADEVWTGIEYQVASHLIWEGFLAEGLTMVKAVRQRHDGFRRNPFNEAECGYHYARSLSSWALLLALSGFKYDMVNDTMSFDPVINQDDFSTFWSTGKAWGTYSQKKNKESGQLDQHLETFYRCQD